jgi:hypothetical protein
MTTVQNGRPVAGAAGEQGTTVRAAALAWHDAGYCVLPAAADGSKRPGIGSWARYQSEQYPRDALAASTAPGIGLVCGAVSGGLEMLELEGRAVDEGAIVAIERLVEEAGLTSLWLRVAAEPGAYLERTPSGGVHILYRVADAPVPGNTKLARRPATDAELAANPDDRVKVLAETRGQGGFVVVAPSHGPTHPTRRPWAFIAGRPGTVPTITAAERDQLHQVFRRLDQMPPPAPAAPVLDRPAPRQRATGDVSPGDDFNQRADWSEVLGPAGWREHYRSDDVTYWTRPGKATGISASTNALGTDRLHVFSTSATGLEGGESYSKFGAYAALHHGGDHRAAARDLARRGYGTPPSNPAADQRAALADLVGQQTGRGPMQHDLPPGKPPHPRYTRWHEGHWYDADGDRWVGPPPWEDPLPLGWQVDLPPFPVDVLPPVLARYVRGLALEVQTPADLPGTVVLGILSACCGGRVTVAVRRNWWEPTNLFLVPVMPPGSRKSAVVSACRQPLTEAEGVLTEQSRSEILNRRTEREIREQLADKAKRAAAADGDPVKIMEAQEAVRAAEGIVVPAWPRLTASDATPEALVSLLAAQGGRIAAISAEAGIFTSLTGRYTKAPNLDPILMAHAGDTIMVDRRGREPERVEDPALTLLASIQPFALRELVDRPDFGGRGLLARILWALPVDNTGHRDVEPPEMPERDREAYRHLVYDLALSMAERTEPVRVVLTDQARKVHLEYHRGVEARLRRGAELGDNLVREWGSKLAGAVARIAGCLHAVSGRLADPIDEQTMRAAVALGDYYQAHAVAALAGADDPATGPARTLLAYLVDKGVTRFTSRDIQRTGPKSLRKAADMRPALDDLTQLGWIREARTGGWEVHPHAAQLLKAGDRGDTGDTPTVSAGQPASAPVAPPVAPPGDTGDTPGDTSRALSPVVAPPGDTPGDTMSHTLTSENAPAVAPVAPVARVKAVRVDGRAEVPTGAVYVGRAGYGLTGSRYANPHRIGKPCEHPACAGATHDRTESLRLYREQELPYFDLAELRRTLAGRDLACWCPPNLPCHADELLALANGHDDASAPAAGRCEKCGSTVPADDWQEGYLRCQQCDYEGDHRATTGQPGGTCGTCTQPTEGHTR